MTVKILSEQHLEFLSLKGGCRGLSESTLIKMPHCWKSHVTARLSYHRVIIDGPGSTTVFNGGEAMTDLLYTRYNNFIEGKL